MKLKRATYRHYECPKCCTTWYRVRHIIIEWVEEKKEGEDEEE